MNTEQPKQQTVVEWLFENYNYITWLRNRDEISQEFADKCRKDYLEQAKKMEKQQIENTRAQITSNCVIKEISDDKIRYAAYKDESVNMGMEPEAAFIEGAKWYREQLKKR